MSCEDWKRVLLLYGYRTLAYNLLKCTITVRERTSVIRVQLFTNPKDPSLEKRSLTFSGYTLGGYKVYTLYTHSRGVYLTLRIVHPQVILWAYSHIVSLTVFLYTWHYMPLGIFTHFGTWCAVWYKCQKNVKTFGLTSAGDLGSCWLAGIGPRPGPLSAVWRAARREDLRAGIGRRPG